MSQLNQVYFEKRLFEMEFKEKWQEIRFVFSGADELPKKLLDTF